MAEPRPSWDEYFLWLAKVAATRATCDRKHVGAVLVKGKSVLSTGYNGSIEGAPHCDEVGHLMEDGHCVRTVHAEANAVAHAARNGTPIDGATCYCTFSPCWPCIRLLANAGIKKVIYSEQYRPDDKIEQHVKSHTWDGKMGVILI